MTGRWVYHTRHGTFSIVAQHGRFEAMFGDDALGHYDTPEAAVRDLVSGRTQSIPGGFDS